MSAFFKPAQLHLSVPCFFRETIPIFFSLYSYCNFVRLSVCLSVCSLFLNLKFCLTLFPPFQSVLLYHFVCLSLYTCSNSLYCLTVYCLSFHLSVICNFLSLFLSFRVTLSTLFKLSFLHNAFTILFSF